MDSAKDETKLLINDEENESFEPMDGTTDTADGLDGDNFEDAIEAPVEEKEKNCENNEKVIEAITQQAFNKKTKEKNEGDSDHFHSFDDANSELRLWNGDEGVIIREIEEDRGDNPISDIIPEKLETEVVNSEEKFEPVDAVYSDGLNHESEQEALNGEHEASTGEEVNDTGTDIILGEAEGMGNDEMKSNEEVPPEKVIQEAQDVSPGLITGNEVEAYDGDRDIVANEEVGVIRRNGTNTDPIIIESDEAQNGNTQSHDVIPHEEIVPESRDIDPLSVTFNGTQNEELYEEVSQKEIVQESKDINPTNVTSDETQNGELQSYEEDPQKEVVEEPRDLGPIVLTSDGSQNGDDQDSQDIKPMSNGTESGDLQSSEDITQEGRDALFDSDAVIAPDLVSIAERYMQTYEVEPVNNDASDANESFVGHANGSHENLVNEVLVQNNGATNPIVDNITEREIREVEADNGSGSIVSHFDESPLVEDASDSSFSDNDENHTDTRPQAAAPAPAMAPAPATAPALPKPAGSPAPPKPAGLGSASLPDPSSTRSVQHVPNGRVAAPQRQSQPSDEAITDELGEHDEIREKLQNIRVKFLRLVLRLGQTPHNTVVAQVSFFYFV